MAQMMHRQTGTAPSSIIKDNTVSVHVCVYVCAHMEMISSSDVKGM